MKIVSSSLQMAAAHAESRQTSVKDTLQIWSGNQRATYAYEATQRSASVGIGAAVQISDAGRQAAARAELSGTARQSTASVSASLSRTDAAEGAKEDDNGLDPKLHVVKTVLERLLGYRIHVYGEHAREQEPAEGGTAVRGNASGLRHDVERTQQEDEQMHFEAQGVVKTADGRDIAFSVQLDLQRSFSSTESFHLQIGQAPKDPLILSYPGQAAELTDTKFGFDLDADGQQEQISFVKPGSGFLVFDRNADGQVNDGSELFGTRSGQGFGELAALDEDGNGWIDENDSAFDKLRLWTKNEAGEDRLQSLLSANIGALSTQNTATPFTFKDAANTEQGVMRASGVFLQEDGQAAGTVSQIDLMV